MGWGMARIGKASVFVQVGRGVQMRNGSYVWKIRSVCSAKTNIWRCECCHLPCKIMQEKSTEGRSQGYFKTRITHRLFGADSIISLDWVSWNICRKLPKFEGENLWFPLDVPLNQPDLLQSTKNPMMPPLYILVPHVFPWLNLIYVGKYTKLSLDRILSNQKKSQRHVRGVLLWTVTLSFMRLPEAGKPVIIHIKFTFDMQNIPIHVVVCC